ncbi:glutathione S-transferase [Candidatus Halocynthiibacter alkanivorans]|uniref:glutathione S-transferase n=1 Tax=Candidatus Halocynthiibacter alkanivorans TaxID=2267619 RepID=UPI000DF4BEDB|nr:glutathione S-transferase [Candidatus Halocynthiibacter alkanivorans]
MTDHILYSFRRCPYAMRARLALQSGGITVALREVVLRDKPAEMLRASPKGTVPVLITGDQMVSAGAPVPGAGGPVVSAGGPVANAAAQVVEESLDVMFWALGRNDPEGWLDMPATGHALIAECDGPFKTSLDRYKYASRHPETDANEERANASLFLHRLDQMLVGKNWLFGEISLADMAMLTFVRQFANVDRAWFDAEPWPDLQRWLETFLASDRFLAIMQKYPQWQPGDALTFFPE